MKTKFTEGEWRYNSSSQSISKPGKNQIAKVWMFGGGEGTANAHLIAAAPEMYEALEHVILLLKPEENPTTIKQIARLLNKARGQE